MLYIGSITKDASQQMTLTGIPGIQIDMTLRFMPRIARWMMGITYGIFQAQGVALVSSPNVLRQFRDNIPFGICCYRGDGLDPYTLAEFADGKSNLYLLDAADVAQVETDFFTGAQNGARP